MTVYQCTEKTCMVVNIIQKITCGNMISLIYNYVVLYYFNFISFIRKKYCSSVVKWYML